MKRFVLDKSVFSRQAKFDFAKLFKSGNRICFGYHFFLECHSKEGVENAKLTLSPLRNHIDMIDILYDDYELIKRTLNNGKGIQKRLIKKSATRNVELLFKNLYSGNRDFEDRSIKLSNDADLILKNRIEDAKFEMKNLESTAVMLKRNNRKMSFQKWEVNSDLINEIKDIALAETIKINEAHNFGKPNEIKNFYVYRLCVAMNFLRCYWVSTGLDYEKVTNFEKYRNDITDLTYLVAGTYFDKFITMETKMKHINKLTLKALEN